MKRLFAAALALLLCSTAGAQTVFQVGGKTCTVTAATSAPTAVQCPGNSGTQTPQFILTNVSSTIDAWISWGQTAGAAAQNAAIPTTTTQFGYYLLRGTQITVSAPPNSFFTGTTASSTAIIYITPGTGQ